MTKNDEILQNHYKFSKKSDKNSEKIEKNFPSVKQEKEISKKENKKESKKDKKSVSKLKTATIIGLAVSTSLLSLATVGLGVGLGIVANKSEEYGNRLEAVYKKSFYDLVDNVNNAEINLSKALASSTASYQKKMLSQVSDNASDAQVNFSSLPLTQSSLNDFASLLNQLGGYTKTLNEKLASGQALSNDEIETLDKLHSVLVDIKAQLNALAIKIRQGYSILDESLNVKDGDNNFTIELSKIKSVDVEYPTMIYDGPFSNSVTNVPVKGLSGSKISKEQARDLIEKTFKNIISLEFENDTLGRFETFNYRLKNADNDTLFIQVSQIGGHILTVSGATGSGENITLDMAQAQVMAVDFAKNNGIENPLVVWTDKIGDEAYFNIAPTQNGIVLYPDLVKVKIDLSNGTILGYDATTYFTNHVQRVLPKATFDMDAARAKVPENFIIQSERVVLAPLDYNREVLCYEFACLNDGDEFYFYINATTGQDENILRVIQTETGNKLL